MSENDDMEISSGKGALKKTDKTPEVSMPIESFAKIFFGHISAERAMRMGMLDVMREEALNRYNSLLRTEYKPFCNDII